MTTAVEKAKARVLAIEEQLKQAKAKAQKAEARVKSTEIKESRKQVERKKYLVGAMMLDEMGKNEQTNTAILQRLNKFLTRPAERELFGFFATEIQVQNQTV